MVSGDGALDRKSEAPAGFFNPDGVEAAGPPMLCAVRGIGRTLDFALAEAKETDRPLYLLFVREQPILTAEDRKRKWRDDEEARAIFTYAKDKKKGVKILPCYAINNYAANTIVAINASWC